MLILTRRTAQTLMIGDNVTVTVLEVRGDRVRIGFKAPREVSVRRVRAPRPKPKPSKYDSGGPYG